MKTYFIWLILCFLPLCAFAQTGKGGHLIKTWIDLSREGEHLALTAFCENLAAENRELSYSLILEKTDANGNHNNSTQAGQIMTPPQTPTQLGSVKFNETPGQRIKAILKISEQDTLVALDSFEITGVQIKKDEKPVLSITPTPKGVIAKEDPVFGIGGLILDETRSKIGTSFYERFYALWQEVPSTHDFMIKIVEMPPRGRASQVQVFFDDHLVFNQHLQPGEEMIENAVQIAIFRTNNYLQNYETMQQNLDGEEKMGNGIY
ncbi:MAG: curli-like amyloid fiber formation chaperone CsgH [Saprospiraceae bacterium]